MRRTIAMMTIALLGCRIDSGLDTGAEDPVTDDTASGVEDTDVDPAVATADCTAELDYDLGADGSVDQRQLTRYGSTGAMERWSYDVDLDGVDADADGSEESLDRYVWDGELVIEALHQELRPYGVKSETVQGFRYDRKDRLRSGWADEDRGGDGSVELRSEYVQRWSCP